MSATALSRGVAAADRGPIPVLDIGSYLAGDPGAAAPLARAIARACEDIGFLVIANHGMAPHLVEDTFAVAAQFFAGPEADKLALKIGKYNIGYLPFDGQVVRHSAGQSEHRTEFQRELLHHSRPRPRPPGHRQSEAAGRAQPLAAGHARIPRRYDSLLPRDGGDDDPAGADRRAGARSTRGLFL